MENIRGYQIKTLNKEHHLVVLKALYGLGATYHGRSTAEDAAKAYPFNHYPFLNVEKTDGRIALSGNASSGLSNYQAVDMDDVINWLSKEPVTVALNANYTATIIKEGDKGIQVNCQFIPAANLAKLFTELRNQGII